MTVCRRHRVCIIITVCRVCKRTFTHIHTLHGHMQYRYNIQSIAYYRQCVNQMEWTETTNDEEVSMKIELNGMDGGCTTAVNNIRYIAVCVYVIVKMETVSSALSKVHIVWCRTCCLFAATEKIAVLDWFLRWNNECATEHSRVHYVAASHTHTHTVCSNPQTWLLHILISVFLFVSALPLSFFLFLLPNFLFCFPRVPLHGAIRTPLRLVYLTYLVFFCIFVRI